MSSFSTSIRPGIAILSDATFSRSHLHDDSALDTDDLPSLHAIPRSNAAKRRASSILTENRTTTVELHPVLPDLQERTRRPSAFRVDSSGADTINTIQTAVGDDSPGKYDFGYTEPPTPASETPGPSYPPSTHTSSGPVSSAEIRKLRVREWTYVATMCWSFFMNGWNDGTIGPLIPVIQRDYGLGFALVSLIFVFGCCGFISGSALNVWLDRKIGLGKTVVIGALFMVMSYVINSPHPPFPVMCLAFFFSGFGIALQNAQANGLVGLMRDRQSIKLSVLHATYGIGAFLAPLSSTYFSTTKHWNFQFIISTGLALVNLLMLAFVFKGRRLRDLLEACGQLSDAELSETSADRQKNNEKNLYKEIFRIRTVHFLAIWALIYIGVEVTVGGWIVTFVIQERNGGPDAGYISSGFFGGLAVGRLGLIWFSRWVGESRVIFVYTAIAIVMEFIIWFVPNIVGNGVAISIIGVVFGPMYPILVGYCTRILPPWMAAPTIGWITGVGVSGSAILPFITGVISGRYGIRSLQPFSVSMMGVMFLLWGVVLFDSVKRSRKLGSIAAR